MRVSENVMRLENGRRSFHNTSSITAEAERDRDDDEDE
jgi:hypothetical protein